MEWVHEASISNLVYELTVASTDVHMRDSAIDYPLPPREWREFGNQSHVISLNIGIMIIPRKLMVQDRNMGP